MADQAAAKRQRDELSDVQRDSQTTKATKTNEGAKPRADSAAFGLEPPSSQTPADRKTPRARNTFADMLPVRFKEKTHTQPTLPRKIRKSTDALPSQRRDDSATTAPASVQPSPVTGHTLIPIDHTRRRAVKGQKDESVLRVQCRYADTNVGKELCYTKQLHAEIDWDSPQHIASINAWIGQIYTRAGFRKKTVSTWHPDEEAYIELYHFLMIAQAQVKSIEKMNNKRLYEDFNYFFANRVMKGKDGESRGSRGKRVESSIASKVVRLVGNLKLRFDEVWAVNEDTGFHEPYRPRITPELLEEYKRAKESLALKQEQMQNLALEKWALDHITKQSAATASGGIASPHRPSKSISSFSSNNKISLNENALALAAYVKQRENQVERNDSSADSQSAHGERAARIMNIDEDYNV